MGPIFAHWGDCLLWDVFIYYRSSYFFNGKSYVHMYWFWQKRVGPIFCVFSQTHLVTLLASATNLKSPCVIRVYYA
jgi:hypothetical protein